MTSRLHRILHKLNLCPCTQQAHGYRKRPLPTTTPKSKRKEKRPELSSVQCPRIRERKLVKTVNVEPSTSPVRLYIGPDYKLIALVGQSAYPVHGITEILCKTTSPP